MNILKSITLLTCLVALSMSTGYGAQAASNNLSDARWAASVAAEIMKEGASDLVKGLGTGMSVVGASLLGSKIGQGVAIKHAQNELDYITIKVNCVIHTNYLLKKALQQQTGKSYDASSLMPTLQPQKLSFWKNILGSAIDAQIDTLNSIGFKLSQENAKLFKQISDKTVVEKIQENAHNYHNELIEKYHDKFIEKSKTNKLRAKL